MKRGKKNIQSSNRETHMQFTICMRITVCTMSCLLVFGFHHPIHAVLSDVCFCLKSYYLLLHIVVMWKGIEKKEHL